MFLSKTKATREKAQERSKQLIVEVKENLFHRRKSFKGVEETNAVATATTPESYNVVGSTKGNKHAPHIE